MANRWGSNGNSDRLSLGGPPKSLQMMTAAMKLKDTCSLEGKLLGSVVKGRDITLPTKVHIVKAMIFPVVMYGCESWIIKKAERQKNQYFWIMVLERTLESPLDSKIKPVNPKRNQPWIFTGRTDAEAEAPILLVTWCQELTHWKRLKAKEVGSRGWDS